MLSEFNYGSPVMQAIINRHKTHQFSGYPLSKGAIEVLLEAGMRISMKDELNRWSFVVIQDGDYIQYLRECSILLDKREDICRGESFHFKSSDRVSNLEEGGSLIVVCANLSLPFSLDHCWLAVENMLLTGSALGFGVSLDGSLLKVLNLSMIKSNLNLPEELTVLTVIVAGEPEKPILPTNNFPPKVWKWLSPV